VLPEQESRLLGKKQPTTETLLETMKKI